MLKITTIEDAEQRTLVLEGKLVDPWLDELQKVWELQLPRGGRVVIDLKDVTVISQHGENLLFRMMNEGAEFNCCRGVLTKHVLHGLERKRGGNLHAKGRNNDQRDHA